MDFLSGRNPNPGVYIIKTFNAFSERKRRRARGRGVTVDLVQSRGKVYELEILCMVRDAITST